MLATYNAQTAPIGGPDWGLQMVLWWIGNAVFLLVVIPIMLWLLNRVLRPTLEIEKYAIDVLDHGVGLTGALDAVPKLVRTTELTAIARGAVDQYGALVGGLL